MEVIRGDETFQYNQIDGTHKSVFRVDQEYSNKILGNRNHWNLLCLSVNNLHLTIWHIISSPLIIRLTHQSL